MPLYEYICKDCKTKFEALVRTTGPAQSVECDSCSGGNVRRLISSFAMVGGFDDHATASQAKSGGGCCGGSCGCGR